jgi:uncharacterized protein YbjT (DUF2867 family)
MVNVAVAGGTSGLGRAITEALLASHKHTVIVLSRQVSLHLRDSRSLLTTAQTTPAKEQEIGTKIVAVDYTNEKQISNLLEKHDISVVISTVNYLRDPTPELCLIRAADACLTVKRYIPSIWGSFKYGEEYDDQQTRPLYIILTHLLFVNL